MRKYDESVLHEAADRLYSQAPVIIITTAANYAFRGFVLTWVGLTILKMSRFGPPFKDIDAFTVAAVASAIFLILGILKGKWRSLELRWRAQQMLLQVQIEQNTRPTGAEKANSAPT